jgi:acyl-CoA oxidase
MPDFSDQLKPLYDGPAQLASERQKSNVQVEELKKHLLSRDNFLDRQTRIVKVLENDPIFDKSQQMNLARPVCTIQVEQETTKIK